MIRIRRATPFTLLAMVLVLGLTACGQSKPSRHYLLRAMPPSDAAREAISVGQGIAIGVEPVTMPDYLERPEIITTGTGSQLNVGEFDRWAEPVDRNIARVMAENLSATLQTDRVFLLPNQRRLSLDYELSVDVIRFDLDNSGESLLVARWVLVDGKTEEELMIARSTISRKVEKHDYNLIVDAMNNNLSQLSQEIATAISTQEGR